MRIQIANVPLHCLANVTVSLDEEVAQELGISENRLPDIENLVRYINRFSNAIEVSDAEFFSIEPDRIEPDSITIEIIK